MSRHSLCIFLFASVRKIVGDALQNIDWMFGVAYSQRYPCHSQGLSGASEPHVIVHYHAAT